MENFTKNVKADFFRSLINGLSLFLVFVAPKQPISFSWNTETLDIIKLCLIGLILLISIASIIMGIVNLVEQKKNNKQSCTKVEDIKYIVIGVLCIAYLVMILFLFNFNPFVVASNLLIR